MAGGFGIVLRRRRDGFHLVGADGNARLNLRRSHARVFLLPGGDDLERTVRKRPLQCFGFFPRGLHPYVVLFGRRKDDRHCFGMDELYLGIRLAGQKEDVGCMWSSISRPRGPGRPVIGSPKSVKVRNHQVVDEWHSLVNPQRPIPAKIVELSGITSQMVRDAPVFHEVADSFMAFMGDGIFVAHNVNFDYGFLSYEYERLERRSAFRSCALVWECGVDILGIHRTGSGNYARSTGSSSRITIEHYLTRGQRPIC
ncbi:hypothetical protein ABIC07_006859 [Bradyrhizobium sp. RT9a]